MLDYLPFKIKLLIFGENDLNMVAISSKYKRPAKKKITWEAFQENYLTREDKYKYEWVDGYVEKTLRSMDKTQFYIQQNITKFFYSLLFKNKINGDLIAEGDTKFGGNHRRPDIAYYTDEQIQKAKNGEDVVAQFVIEVISTTDQINRVHKKMKDYRAADVKIIWHIFPELKLIHVYKGKDMKVCEGEDICSAEEVIKGYSLSVNDVFK